MNIDGKMKMTVGKSIFTGAFIAFSSAAICRRWRVSTAWTRRMRPSEIPNWSAWMIARANAPISVMPVRSASFLSAVLAALADPHLVERQRELLAERPLELLRDLHDGGVEAEAGLDADGKQVERIRKIGAEPLLASADLLVEDEVRAR